MTTIDQTDKDTLYTELKNEIATLRLIMFYGEQTGTVTMSIATIGNYIEELASLRDKNQTLLLDRLFNQYMEMFTKCLALKQEKDALKSVIESTTEQAVKEKLVKNILKLDGKIDELTISFENDFNTGGEHIDRDYDEGMLYKFTRREKVMEIYEKYFGKEYE